MTDLTMTNSRARFLMKDYAQGFIAYCGFYAVHAERGLFTARVDIGEQHRQQDGFIHAGVMAAMADHTAGYSAFTVVPEGMRILTVEFKINFLRPARGEAMICRARVLREGRKVIVSESEVFDVDDGEETLAAKALVTLMAVPEERLASGSR